MSKLLKPPTSSPLTQSRLLLPSNRRQRRYLVNTSAIGVRATKEAGSKYGRIAAALRVTRVSTSAKSIARRGVPREKYRKLTSLRVRRICWAEAALLQAAGDPADLQGLPSSATIPMASEAAGAGREPSPANGCGSVTPR